MASSSEEFYVQNAANAASAIVAALIRRSDQPVSVEKAIEAFDQVREHIFSQTLGLAPPQTTPQGSSANPALRCPHGERIVRKGTNAKGPWTGYFCRLDRDDPTRCEPIFK